MSARPLRLRTNRYVVPAVAVVAIFGAYGVTSATGTWSSSGRTAIDAGQAIAPSELKGWMTVRQVADGVRLDVPTVLRLAGADAALAATIDPDAPLSELEAKIPGFSVASLRTALAAHLGTGPAASTPPAGAASPTVTPATTTPSSHPTPTGTGPRTGPRTGSSRR